MRVLHVITSLDAQTGGVAVALEGLARAQAAVGLTVSIVTHGDVNANLSAVDLLQRQGVKVLLLGPRRKPFVWPRQDAKALGSEIHNADIIHIHGLWEEIQHRTARGAGSTPYVFSPHGMLDPWSLRQSRWKKRLYLALRLRRNLNQASALHYTTSVERNLVGSLGLRPSTILEPNGLDLEEFSSLPAPGTFRLSHPITEGRKLIIFLSRLHPKKGLDLLIPAFSAMRDRNAVLAIVGPDSMGYQKTVQVMIEREGVKDRVFFTGILRGKDRIAALRDADLFVLPSYQENFGIAVIESLAAGTPVIISDQVNLYPDILNSGVGEVVPMDKERLCATLDRWLLDDELRNAAAKMAAPFAKKRYDWRQIAERWKGHYSDMLQRPHAL